MHDESEESPPGSDFVPAYRSATAKYTPQEWSEVGKNFPVGTFDRTKFPTVVANFERERNANGGLDMSQVPRDLSTVAWYWQCGKGHRWRETTYGVLSGRYGYYSRKAPRWKSFGGTMGACRRCVLDKYGARYEKCGHGDTDLGVVNDPPRTLPGWCPTCRGNASTEVLGDAVRAAYDPPTSKEEATLRAILSQRLPLARPEEANAVVVPVTSWGSRRVFPDMLIPVRKVAIEYDSPGAFGDAHGPDSQDAEKDASLRSVGWEVIRARVGLPLVGPYDVAATGPTRKAAEAVTRQYSRILADRGARLRAAGTVTGQ